MALARQEITNLQKIKYSKEFKVDIKIQKTTEQAKEFNIRFYRNLWSRNVVIRFCLISGIINSGSVEYRCRYEASLLKFCFFLSRYLFAQDEIIKLISSDGYRGKLHQVVHLKTIMF